MELKIGDTVVVNDFGCNYLTYKKGDVGVVIQVTRVSDNYLLLIRFFTGKTNNFYSYRVDKVEKENVEF